MLMRFPAKSLTTVVRLPSNVLVLVWKVSTDRCRYGGRGLDRGRVMSIRRLIGSNKYCLHRLVMNGDFTVFDQLPQRQEGQCDVLRPCRVRRVPSNVQCSNAVAVDGRSI